MTTFECKVSDLSMKEPVVNSMKEPVENSKNVTFREKTEDLRRVVPTTHINTELSLFDRLTNTDIIKASLITLLVFLLVNSDIVKNILLNSFDFLNNNGDFNILGNTFVYLLTMITYFYLSLGAQ